MKYEIVGKPDFSIVRLTLDANEKATAETGAMVAMSTNMKIETKAKGGLLGGLKRMVGGESFFTNDYHAEGGPGTIEFAPSAPGDVDVLELKGNAWFVQRGAYLCHVGDITTETKFGGVQSFFSGEGLFMLRVSGTGHVFFNSYGGLQKVSVNGEYIVDTTHIVAFPEGMTYNVEAVGGLKATFLSGEGLVCRYRGTGDLYTQTRSAPPFASWLNPFRRVESKK